MHRRALRNGALAATRPVTHEAFEFWHDQQHEGGGSGLESHGSREGGPAYSEVGSAFHERVEWSCTISCDKNTLLLLNTPHCLLSAS